MQTIPQPAKSFQKQGRKRPAGDQSIHPPPRAVLGRCAGLLAMISIMQFTAIPVSGEPVKIFILAGQSNMVGHGNMTPDTAINTLEHLVNPANDTAGDYQFLKDGADWKVWDDVWIDYLGKKGDLTTGYGTTGAHVGPEIGFGHVASVQFENQVLIIKCAWGGKSLGRDFLPPSAESYPTPQADGDKGFYYQQILNAVSRVTSNLGTIFPGYAGQGFEIAGFGWHQGYNDRVDDDFSAAYQTNMAHFIRDMRSADKGLDIPNLPFVIVTSAMDGNGPEIYSPVEMAQRAMVDPYLTNANPPDLYSDFVGNVAVVDARKTYNGLQFWYPASESPVSQGFHWNRNARTYVNIGLAMGDAMSGLSPGRCPSRLRAAGAASSGVELIWQNGEETPTSVQIMRNGVEIAAAAPVIPASFTDTPALPGFYEYELIFTMPGDSCNPLTVTFDGGITDALAFRSPGGVGLSWNNAMSYTGIEVRRDGVVIQPDLPGDATSYTDTTAPSSGLVSYTLTPTTGTSTPATTQIILDGLPSGNALIYEPFDYAVGGLNAKSGISELGLAGTWDANGSTLVTAGTLSYGHLPVGGGKLSDFTTANRFGGTRGINASALADQGMLDDGATLWFSLIVGYDTGGTVTNSRLSVALANSGFSKGNNRYWINDEGEQIGAGVGITLGRINSINGRVVATRFLDLAAGDTAPSIHGSWTGIGSTYGEGTHGLIVGKITWASDPADPDTIEIYQPGTDLALPANPISVLNTVVDQTEFDTITFGRGNKVVLDEIRFGASYDDVIGAEGAPGDYENWAAEYPEADLTDPDADYDLDGVSNRDERIWGSDPTSGSSSEPILSIPNPVSGTLSYQRRNPALSAATFSYEWSTTLEEESWKPFMPSSENASGASPVESVEITLPADLLEETRLFVRVVGTEG